MDRKHYKNLDILAMMGVCRPWNDRIRGMKGLFTDIAFDTSDHNTLYTASTFLGIVETRPSDLHVYARCHALGDHMAVSKTFLSRLRLHSWRFVCFEVENMSASFITHFDLPAPRLLRLVSTPVHPEGLFASSFTSLRVLDVAVGDRFPWPSATLSNLVVLRLENSQFTRRFCATSLFDLIERAQELEELRLTDFLRFSGSSNKRPIVRTGMKFVHFVQCNSKFILQNLQLPDVTRFHIESYGIGLDGEPSLPSSREIGHFAPLQSLSIQSLDQHTITGIVVHVQDWFTDNVYFRICLKGRAGWTTDVTVTLRKGENWQVYLRSSVNELLQRVRLSPRISLSAFHHLPLSHIHPPQCAPPLPFDLPIFRLSQVTVLTTDQSLVRGITLCLGDPECNIFPNLKCYSFDIRTQQTPVDLVAPEMRSCLRVRFSRGLPFALQYWALSGKCRSDAMSLLCTDIRLSTDSDWMDTTTVLIQGSLPALAPLLRETGSGFTGEGGNVISGDLYVEHSTFKLEQSEDSRGSVHPFMIST